jgi:hypothetical protein
MESWPQGEARDPSSNLACKCRRDGHTFCGDRTVQILNPPSEYSSWGKLRENAFEVSSQDFDDANSLPYTLTAQIYLSE